MNSSVYFITDCHFNVNHNISEAKVESLANIIKNDPNEFIFLTISGDISYSGKSVEYDLFCKFFNTIKEKSGKDIKLITCPGNHDINFSGESYSLRQLIEDTKKENIMTSFKKRITMLASYQSFERKNVNSNNLDEFLQVSNFDLDDREIIFYSMNNVLFSCFGDENKSDDTRNHAYLSEKTIQKIKRSNPKQIVFLLMHFPLNYFDDKICHFLKEKIAKNVDFVLTGHLHVPEKEIIIDKGNVNIIQGDYFSKGTLDEKGSFIKIDLRNNRYIEFKWEDDSYIEQDNEIKIELKASRWNSHGISFNNDFYSDLTRCDILDKNFNINEIFVFPCLSKEKYNDFEDRESIIKEFPALALKAKNNPFIFIYGDEGSGKTSLAKYLTLLFLMKIIFLYLVMALSFLKLMI